MSHNNHQSIKAVVRFSNIKKFSADKFSNFLNSHGRNIFKVEQPRILYCGEGKVYAILEPNSINIGLNDICKHALLMDGGIYSHKSVKVSMSTLEDMKRSYEKYKKKMQQQQSLKENSEKLSSQSYTSLDNSENFHPSAVINGNGNHIYQIPNPDKAYSTTSSNLFSNMSGEINDTETRPEQDFIILFKGKGPGLQ